MMNFIGIVLVIITVIIAIILLIAVVYGTENPQPCSIYANSDLAYVPARCVKYFEK